MIPKYLQVGRGVWIWMAPFWTPGTVAERNPNHVVISVSGRLVAVHQTAIRRDVRAIARGRVSRVCR